MVPTPPPLSADTHPQASAGPRVGGTRRARDKEGQGCGGASAGLAQTAVSVTDQGRRRRHGSSWLAAVRTATRACTRCSALSAVCISRMEASIRVVGVCSASRLVRMAWHGKHGGRGVRVRVQGWRVRA
jgi:hypothetical protein